MRHGKPVAAFTAALLCANCSGWQSAFDTHGAEAIGLAHLMTFIMTVCAAVWTAVVAVLAWALWRRRHPRPDPLAADARTERKMALVVMGSVTATIVIITIFTAASFVATRALTSPAGDALIVRIRGYQWWWEITYLDPRTDQTFTTANELHVPVGRPVRIRLAAADVIHSFWVPSLAGKQDLIPGRDNDLTFTAQRAGVYRGQCAEFCGLQHARMAVLVVAQEPELFETWRQSQLAGANVPTAPEQIAGRQVFETKSCAACHTVRGTQANGSLGPDLTHVGSRKTIAAGVFDNTRGSLAAWIADPQTIKPGNNMPMVNLTADELNAVSAYLTGLK
jgi:cytochrome c oxidase subunit 2